MRVRVQFEMEASPEEIARLQQIIAPPTIYLPPGYREMPPGYPALPPPLDWRGRIKLWLFCLVIFSGLVWLVRTLSG